MTRTNADLLRIANTTADDLGQLCGELMHGTLQRIAQAQAGPAATWPGGSRSNGGHADPTYTAALRGADLASTHRTELERCLVRAGEAVRRALTVAQLYPEAHPAHETDRLALARVNGRPEPGCASCARTTQPDGTPRWEPTDPRLDGYATTVGGMLDAPMHLCRWCYDRVVLWNRLPSLPELERRHTGKRVTWPTDVERPA